MRIRFTALLLLILPLVAQGREATMEVEFENKTGAFLYVTLSGLESGSWMPVLNQRLVPPMFTREYYHSYYTNADRLSRFHFLVNHALYPEEPMTFEVNTLEGGRVFEGRYKYTISFEDEKRMRVLVEPASLWEKFKEQL